MTRRDEQRGAALLTVLLLTATLAVLAVGMTELMTRSAARSSASEARDQAFWGLWGLEGAALGFIEQNAELLADAEGRLFAEPVTVPFEDGLAVVTFSERSNCFNINDLVASGEDGEYVRDDGAVERFSDLVQALGGTKTGGEQIAARIVDFMDTGQRAEAGGAEDYDYQRRPVPYRTPGGLLSSVSELRAIAGFSRDVYRSLAPYLCALPTDGPQMLNVNTLTLKDAPQLAAIFGESLNVSAVEALIDRRPAGGFETTEEFLGQPALAGADLPPDAANFLDTGTTLLGTEVVLQGRSGRLRQTSTVIIKDGRPEVIERTVGERLP